MNVIISHKSALTFLDRCARTKQAAFRKTPTKTSLLPASDTWARTKRQLATFNLERSIQPGRDIDILVPYNKHMHSPKGFMYHGPGGTLPQESLLDAGNDVLVCSAPLAFAMMCGTRELTRCIRLGSFICGTYSLERTSRSGVVERAPLATHKELLEFILRADGIRGYLRAKNALAWVLEGAASPQETELALPFYLPHHLNGKGFIQPTMNYKVTLDEQEHIITGKDSFRVDVCWPEQGIGFEYSSFAEHSQPKKIADDETRRLILQSKGIHVELVTKQQMEDPKQIDLLAALLDEHGVPRIH